VLDTDAADELKFIVTLSAMLFVTKLLKTTSSLEKQARHINEHHKNTLG